MLLSLFQVLADAQLSSDRRFVVRCATRVQRPSGICEHKHYTF